MLTGQSESYSVKSNYTPAMITSISWIIAQMKIMSYVHPRTVYAGRDGGVDVLLYSFFKLDPRLW